MVCGGFACSKNCLCALNLLYTVSIPSPFLSPRGFAPAGCSVATSSGPPLPVFSHALRPRLRHRSPPGTRSRRLSPQSLPFIVKPPSFWLGGRASLPYCSTPPLIHRLVFQSFDQTSPLCHPHYPFRNSLLAPSRLWGEFGGERAARICTGLAKIA